MTSAPPTGEGLGRSLIEALGQDCGAAAVIARVVSEHQGGTISAARFESVPVGIRERVLRDFATRGWLAVSPTGWTLGPVSIPPSVPAFLEGAAAMRGTKPDSGIATAVVTMPAAPSAVARALPATGVNHAGLVSTAQAFERVADAAINKLVVMTPFLNPEGLAFVLELFKRTPAGERLLIVRRSGGALRTVHAHGFLMTQACVRVLDYTLPAGTGYETFHAKVVLADQDLAYVGSANMTVFARHSMELGVLMDGRAARVVASVVRAVERVATRVCIDNTAILRPSATPSSRS